MLKRKGELFYLIFYVYLCHLRTKLDTQLAVIERISVSKK